MALPGAPSSQPPRPPRSAEVRVTRFKLVQSSQTCLS
ncbi:mCG147927 [Mus musculus]|nr:mCG147927 [Mus musculus]